MSPIFRVDRSDAAASTTHAIMRDESRSRNTTKRRTAPTRRTSSAGANGVPNGIGTQLIVGTTSFARHIAPGGVTAPRYDNSGNKTSLGRLYGPELPEL